MTTMLERIRERRSNRGAGGGEPRTAAGPDTAADNGSTRADDGSTRADDGSTGHSRVRGAASGVASGVATGTRRLRSALATVITLVTGLIALLIVIAIAFVVFKANPSNSIVSWVHDTAKFFVGPFDGMFKPKSHRAEIAINWGIAAAVYVFVGRLIARLVAPARRD